MASSLITTINEEHRTIAKLLHLIDRQVMLFAESVSPDLDLLRPTLERAARILPSAENSQKTALSASSRRASIAPTISPSGA